MKVLLNLIEIQFTFSKSVVAAAPFGISIDGFPSSEYLPQSYKILSRLSYILNDCISQEQIKCHLGM